MLYLSTSLNPTIALHIEAMLLADGTHELLPKLVNEQPEVQINLTEDNEDLNVNPKSERTPPKASPVHNPSILNYVIYLLVHLSYWS